MEETMSHARSVCPDNPDSGGFAKWQFQDLKGRWNDCVYVAGHVASGTAAGAAALFSSLDIPVRLVDAGRPHEEPAEGLRHG